MVVLAPPAVIFKPVPLVAPVFEMDALIPVKVAVLLVIRAKVPAVEAVDDRSNKVPVVVAVSAEVEDNLKSEPPLEMTEVVCGMIRAVPVVRALAVMA